MNYYEILQVSSAASHEVIQMAYQTLQNQYHIESLQGDKKYAELKMQQLDEAYRVLSSPILRQQYDNMLRMGDAQNSLDPQVPQQQSQNSLYKKNQNVPPKKRILAALLVILFMLVAAVGLIQYNHLKDLPDETPAEMSMDMAEDEVVFGDLKISVFWYDEFDVYLRSVRDAMNKEFAALGITPDNQYAANNQSTQLDQIKTAIAGGADVLVVNQVTYGAPDVAEDIIAAAGNIPVIFFNRAIGTDGSDVAVLEANNTVVYIGTDSLTAGHMQGKMIGDCTVANFDAIDLNGDGSISYAMFMGDEANIEAIYRTQYSVENANTVLETNGKPALVYFDAANTDCYQVDKNGAWSAAAAMKYMDTNFVSYNEAKGNMIELVICNNDGMAEGVIASLQGKGYNVPGAHVVPVFGIDATANAKALIAEGAMTGTIKQDAEGMAAAIVQTVKAVAGGAVPAEALATLKDERFTIAPECASKLYVAYVPYTGE